MSGQRQTPRPVRVFRPEDAQRAVAELEQGAIRTASDLDAGKHDRWVVSRPQSGGLAASAGKVGGTITAKFGDYLAVDTKPSAVSVLLPTPAGTDNGKEVAVQNATGSPQNLTVQAPDGRTINGAATLAVNAAWAWAMLVTDGVNYFART